MLAFRSENSWEFEMPEILSWIIPDGPSQLSKSFADSIGLIPSAKS